MICFLFCFIQSYFSLPQGYSDQWEQYIYNPAPYILPPPFMCPNVLGCCCCEYEYDEVFSESAVPKITVDEITESKLTDQAMPEAERETRSTDEVSARVITESTDSLRVRIDVYLQESVTKSETEFTTDPTRISVSDNLTKLGPSLTTESTTGLTIKLSTESTTESVRVSTTELPEESPTASTTESVTVSTTELNTESPTKSTTEIVTVLTTELPEESPTESKTESITNSTTELNTESSTESTAELVTEAKTELETESPSQSTEKALTEPTTDATTESATETVTEVTIKVKTESIAEYKIESTESTTEETTQSVTKAIGSISESSSASVITENVTRAEQTNLSSTEAVVFKRQETTEPSTRASGRTTETVTSSSEPREIYEYNTKGIGILKERSAERNLILVAADAEEYLTGRASAVSTEPHAEDDLHLSREYTTAIYRLSIRRLTTQPHSEPVTEDEDTKQFEDYEFPYLEPA